MIDKRIADKIALSAMRAFPGKKAAVKHSGLEFRRLGNIYISIIINAMGLIALATLGFNLHIIKSYFLSIHFHNFHTMNPQAKKSTR